jgi:hypothetical protein
MRKAGSRPEGKVMVARMRKLAALLMLAALCGCASPTPGSHDFTGPTAGISGAFEHR